MRASLALVIVWCATGCGSPHQQARDAAAEVSSELHHILVRNCPVTRLPASWPLMPGWVCRQTPGDLNRLHCTEGLVCKHQEECTAKPFGRCMGYGKQTCEYGLSKERCSVDADCVTLADGRCPPSFPPNELCYPDGTCESGPHCYYPALQEPCEGDADCSILPGGRCVKAVTHSDCQYNSQCEVDSDCGTGLRCACTDGDMFCVRADCSHDSDCSSGQRCMPTPTCAGIGIAGYHCTTTADTCRIGEDCSSGLCAFNESASRWDCSAMRCTVP